MAFFATATNQKTAYDWSQMPIQALNPLKDAAAPYFDRPERINEVLGAMVLYIRIAFSEFDVPRLSDSHQIFNPDPDHRGSSKTREESILHCWHIDLFGPDYLKHSSGDISDEVKMSALYKHLEKSVGPINVSSIWDLASSDNASGRIDITGFHFQAVKDCWAHENANARQTQFLLEAKDWLFACLLETFPNEAASMSTKLRSFIGPQPNVDRSTKDDFPEQLQERLSDTSCGLWPHLTRMLQTLKDEDEATIVSVIKVYLRLAANVVAADRSSRFSLQDWPKYIIECERRYTDLVESAFSPYPLRVRKILAREFSYLGNWHFICNRG